jgi:hypothetical protein
LPQPPQLASSALVSTQAPEQREKPASHTAPQIPFEQVAVPSVTAGQTMPQPLQWLTAVFVSTHSWPQRLNEPLQVKSQPVVLQTGMALAGALQLLPHCLQFEVSLVRSTQEPSQAVSEPQSSEQTRDLQTWPALHAVVQLPQCWPSEAMSTHFPSQLL